MFFEGDNDDSLVGTEVGIHDGNNEGFLDAANVGDEVDIIVGAADGVALRLSDGACEVCIDGFDDNELLLGVFEASFVGEDEATLVANMNGLSLEDSITKKEINRVNAIRNRREYRAPIIVVFRLALFNQMCNVKLLNCISKVSLQNYDLLYRYFYRESFQCLLTENVCSLGHVCHH